MEGGLIMTMHSVVIGILAYIIMVFGLKQSSAVAEDRSALLGAIALMYMVVFGHGPPKKINKHLM